VIALGLLLASYEVGRKYGHWQGRTFAEDAAIIENQLLKKELIAAVKVRNKFIYDNLWLKRRCYERVREVSEDSKVE